MGVVARVVSSRTMWCLAYLYSECYAFPEPLVYAVNTCFTKTEELRSIAAKHWRVRICLLLAWYCPQRQTWRKLSLL
jgi:hypothetical protein